MCNKLIRSEEARDLLRGCAITSPHQLRAVDAHNQLLLGPNGIRATCATCAGAAVPQRGRAGLRDCRAGGRARLGRLPPCPQSARAVSSAPPTASPGSSVLLATPAAPAFGAGHKTALKELILWAWAGSQPVPRFFTAARGKRSSPMLCPHQWEAHAPSLTALLLLTDSKTRAEPGCPFFLLSGRGHAQNLHKGHQGGCWGLCG